MLGGFGKKQTSWCAPAAPLTQQACMCGVMFNREAVWCVYEWGEGK